MATTLNALTLRINADTEGVAKAVRAVRGDINRINRIMGQTASATDKARQAQDSLNRVYKAGAISSQDYARALDSIGRKYTENSGRQERVNALIRQHIPQVDRLEGQMTELKAEFKAGNIAATDFYRTMRNLSDQYRRLRLQTEYASDATDKFNRQNREASDGTRRSSGQMSSGATIVGGLSSRLLALGVAYGAVRQAQKGMQDQFELDRAIRQLEIFSGSEAVAGQLVKQMESLAAATPLTFNALASAATRFAGVNVPMSEMIDTLGRIGDISRGNNEVFDRLSLAYSQIVGKGRLMGQELNQLSEGGFQLLNAISSQTGESIAQLRDRMEKGAISAAEVTRAIKAATSEGGQFNNLLNELSDTNEAKLNKLSNSFSILRRNLTSIITGPLAKFSTLFTSFFDKINGLFDKMRENIAFVRDGKIPEAAAEVVEMGKAVKELAASGESQAKEAEKQEPRWKAANKAVQEMIAALDKENQQILLGNREYERRQMIYAGATEQQMKFLAMAQEENDKLKEKQRIEENIRQGKLAELQQQRQQVVANMRKAQQMPSRQTIKLELPPSITKGSKEEYKKLVEEQNKRRKEHLERLVLMRQQKAAQERAAKAAEEGKRALDSIDSQIANLQTGTAV